jgi:hypothetical protein
LSDTRITRMNFSAVLSPVHILAPISPAGDRPDLGLHERNLRVTRRGHNCFSHDPEGTTDLVARTVHGFAISQCQSVHRRARSIYTQQRHSLWPKLTDSPYCGPPFPMVQSYLLEQRDAASPPDTSHRCRSIALKTGGEYFPRSAFMALTRSRGCPEDVRLHLGADVREALREGCPRDHGARGRVQAVLREH